MANSTSRPCRFHSAPSPGEAIVGCGCPSDVNSRFHGRGTFGLSLSASQIGDTVAVVPSSASGKAYPSLHKSTDHGIDALAVTTLGTGLKRRYEDLTVSHMGTPKDAERLIPCQLARPANGESSDLLSFLGRPNSYLKVGLQEQTSRTLDERDKMRGFREDFVLFPDKDLTRRAATTHLPLLPLQQDPTDLPMQPPTENGNDWYSRRLSRQQPPPTPRTTQLPDPDLDKVEESDFFPSLDELEQQR